MIVDKDRSNKFYLKFIYNPLRRQDRELEDREKHGMLWLSSVQYGFLKGTFKPWGNIKPNYTDGSSKVVMTGKWVDKRNIKGTWHVIDKSKNRKAGGSWKVTCSDGYYWVMK